MSDPWTPDPSDLDLLDESRREWRRDEHWADIADLLIDIDVPMPPPLEPDAPQWERDLLDANGTPDDYVTSAQEADVIGRGLIVAIGISLVLWTGIVFGAVRVVRWIGTALGGPS